MEFILEDLYENILSETNISDFNLLSEEGSLKNRIKNIVEEVFESGESDNVTLDNFFISMADTPTVSGSLTTHRNLSNFNQKESTFNNRKNIVNTIAELEDSINIKENELVASMIKNGFDKKLIKKIDGDLSFDKTLYEGLSAAFEKQQEDVEKNIVQQNTQGNVDESILLNALNQNQNNINYLLKDGVLLETMTQLSKRNDLDLLDISVLETFLNLPALVQECSTKELYQEALFLQQAYLNNMHRYKTFLIRTKQRDIEKDESAESVGIPVLDSIKDFITKVIKDDMVSKLQDTLVTTSDFIILKRVIDVIVKVNQDDLKSLEMFINARYKYLSEYLSNSLKNNTNIMDILDFFREELFNILNIYQLIFASNDTKRNLPNECFMKDFLLECKVNYKEPEQELNKKLEQEKEVEEVEKEEEINEEEKEIKEDEKEESKEDEKIKEEVEKVEEVIYKPKYTNILILKLLNDSFNDLLNDKIFQSEKMYNKNYVLQLIYCAYRLKDSNINYFHLMLNKLIECGLFSEEELLKSIEKRKELSMILNN
ncbi:hypothetical protein ACO0SA_001629 [Hanseniaspora valbyensis]